MHKQLELWAELVVGDSGSAQHRELGNKVLALVGMSDPLLALHGQEMVTICCPQAWIRRRGYMLSGSKKAQCLGMSFPDPRFMGTI
jgi:hypothetical protein